MTYKEMISISSWYNTMKCQLQSMSGTLQQIVNYNPKFILGTLPTKDVSYSVSECQVCTVPKDVIYMKLSGIEMSYT